MLNPPERFPEELLPRLLAEHWNLPVEGLDYVPLGFGTHHWSAIDSRGGRWFVNVDELPDDPTAAAVRLRRLANALGAARALRDHGHTFAVAPEPSRSGDVVVRLGTAYAVSLYRHLDGESYTWGGWHCYPPEHGAAIRDILTELHAVPPMRRGPADVEDFVIPDRDVLEKTLAERAPSHADRPDGGPYTARAVTMVTQHATTIVRMISHYDGLAAEARSHPHRFVLTHGEPHPGNTMRVDGRYVLIDWESALIAPPERDLWNFGSAGSTEGPGVPAMRELYALRWDLAEIALYTAQFLRPHTDSPNERLAWKGLTGTVRNLEITAARI